MSPVPFGIKIDCRKRLLVRIGTIRHSSRREEAAERFSRERGEAAVIWPRIFITKEKELEKMGKDNGWDGRIYTPVFYWGFL